MWYGSNSLPKCTRQLKNKAFRSNYKDRRIGFTQEHDRSYPSTRTLFQVPGNWNLVLLREKHSSKLVIYLFNQTYFTTFTPLSSLLKLSYSPQTQTLIFDHHFSSYLHYAYLLWLGNLFARFQRPFFKKIRFKGKGYYMYKNARNTIAPQFGYAHRVYIYSQATSVKFLSKTKILLFGLSALDATNVAYNLKKVKPINIFTGRGVRFARQLVYKKTGKVSSYR